MDNGNLKRELSLLDVFVMTTAAMISAELFVLPGLAYARAGPAAIFAFLLAGVIALPAMLSAAELVSAMPKAGGIYFFTSRSMGYATGTIAGFSRWLSISLKSAFALIGIGAYTAMFTGIPITYIAAACCLLFILVNLIGIKLVGRVQTLLLLISGSIFIIYILYGITAIHPERYSPLMPNGPESLLSTAGFLFISYGALLMVTSLAEEVKKPEKNIPLGMFLSLLVVAILYSLVVYVTVGIMEPADLANSMTPLSDGARILFGSLGVTLIVIAAIDEAISTANSGLSSASRYPLAMSRDGLLPRFLQRIDPRSCVPKASVLATGAFMLAVVLFVRLELLVEVASTLLMISYILTNLAVILMRENKKAGYAPHFRSPMYPWTQILGILGLTALILSMGAAAILLSGSFITASLLWYRLYAAKRLNPSATDPADC